MIMVMMEVWDGIILELMVSECDANIVYVNISKIIWILCAINLGLQYISKLSAVAGKMLLSGQDSSRSYAVNNNTVKNATKFTIGTSDESDEDDNEEDTQDLEHLFCPLTDSQVHLNNFTDGIFFSLYIIIR